MIFSSFPETTLFNMCQASSVPTICKFQQDKDKMTSQFHMHAAMKESYRHYFIIIIITSNSILPSKKNNVVYKLFFQPHKHLRHRKLKKTQLREATNGWLHPWTHPAFRCPTQCKEGHSTFEPGPARNTFQIGMFYTLILQTPMDELWQQLEHVEL